MKNDIFETLVGAAVVAIAGLFFFYAYTNTDSGAKTGYELVAVFGKIDGVAPGTDVRMSGIKIGTVSSQELDPNTYRAVVRMTISSEIELPEDSSVKVSAEGLLGGNYLDVEPGGSMDMLADGDEFLIAQGSVSIMDLVGQVVTGINSSE